MSGIIVRKFASKSTRSRASDTGDCWAGCCPCLGNLVHFPPESPTLAVSADGLLAEERLAMIITVKLTSVAPVTLCFLMGCLMSGQGADAVVPKDDVPLLAKEVAELPWERASVKLGAFFANFNSDLGFAVGPKDSVLISGEDTLGLPSTMTVFRGDALYRIGKARSAQRLTSEFSQKQTKAAKV